MPNDVIVNEAQLRSVFKQHSKAVEKAEQSNNASPSHELLRFYANECGLKALFLNKYYLRDIGEFKAHFGDDKKWGHGHDLIRWLDELNLPETQRPQVPRGNIRHTFHQLHEKLRYGKQAEIEEESLNKGFHIKLQKLL